ncbi:AbrB/MazE/SpoVT family DNA-binding domain-containing protein [Sporosarcina sp. BI001-red]|uniref:AbrB/MazE/SpoVT family DNA-binding domain-containing protein n=1 Tax=Sporosarcina sp. BI001-red TaxID=2282866 RepID=UPI000E23DE13|nr:AbrB/MazE/SpoVT family DNA-binding domain-containing protein [Sporosarcina sp. BI001-red]REB11600.1 AbrB/MazE/SpoVT family DNA-binding domain-containing protein [Sporosarcina sp. BI001-red]
MDENKYTRTNQIQYKEFDFISTITAQKWGNSLGIRIPKEAADSIGIKPGSELELQVFGNENTITLKTKKPKKNYSLEELLTQITDENRHAEIDLGSEGREMI